MITPISITIIPHRIPPVTSWWSLLNSPLPICSSHNNLSDCHCSQIEIRLCHSTAWNLLSLSTKTQGLVMVLKSKQSALLLPLWLHLLLLSPPSFHSSHPGLQLFLKLARQTSSSGPLHWLSLLHGNFFPSMSTCFFFGSFFITFSVTPLLTTLFIIPALPSVSSVLGLLLNLLSDFIFFLSPIKKWWELDERRDFVCSVHSVPKAMLGLFFFFYPPLAEENRKVAWGWNRV